MNSHKKGHELNDQIPQIIDNPDTNDITLYLKNNNVQKPLLDLLKKIDASNKLLKNKYLKCKKKLIKMKNPGAELRGIFVL